MNKDVIERKYTDTWRKPYAHIVFPLIFLIIGIIFVLSICLYANFFYILALLPITLISWLLYRQIIYTDNTMLKKIERQNYEEDYFAKIFILRDFIGRYYLWSNAQSVYYFPRNKRFWKMKNLVYFYNNKES